MLLKNYFYEMLEINPQLGSFIGYRKYDDQYANYFSKEYEQKFKQLNMKYARMLHSKGSSSVDDEVLEFITKMNLMHNDELNLMPMTSYSNMILDFSFENTNYYPINKKNEHKRYLGFLEVLETSIQLMKTGVEKGYVIPKFICEKMIKMLKKVDLRGSDIMKRLLEFLETEYLPACRSTIGLCHLPKGKVLYKYLVMCQLTIDMPIEEIHKFGITEVKRISEELKKHKTSQQKMKNIIGAYQVQRNYIRNNIIPKYFGVKVKPYKIKHVPSTIKDSTSHAFYVSPTSKRPGTFYINPDANNVHDIVPLSLHEGEPGHHYQFQYMMDKKIPLYKIYSNNSCIFIEGWALYAETFNDQDMYGKLLYDLYRTVRLVVDTGIHYYGWTYSRAVNYMRTHVKLPLKLIKKEIERYICVPGQALCYKIGQYKLLELRKLYFDHFGETDRNYKNFHKLILEDGVIPLHVLQNKIKKIIRSPKV
jgi:uncharacterized protein (DUF885 family)